jgi:glycerol-3-phosphate dehydrogenase
MAERVVNRVAEKIKEEQGTKIKECSTDKIPLCGNDFKKYKHVKKYIAEVHDRIKTDGFAEYEAWYLVTTYGKQTEEILANYGQGKEKDAPTRLILAELKFGMDHEMIQNPMDFFIRRTGRLYFDIDSVRQFMDPVLEAFKVGAGASEDEVAAWRKTLEDEIQEHSNFSLERA